MRLGFSHQRFVRYVWVLVLVVLFFPKLITCLRFPTFAMFKLGGGMEVCLNVNCPSVNFWNNFDPILKDPLWKAWTTRSCHFCSVSYFPHWNLFFDFWLLAGWLVVFHIGDFYDLWQVGEPGSHDGNSHWGRFPGYSQVKTIVQRRYHLFRSTMLDYLLFLFQRQQRWCLRWLFCSMVCSFPNHSTPHILIMNLKVF